MNLDELRACTPWSFFLPMWLAVTLGVLIANALGAALFGGDDAAEPPGGAVEAAAAANDEAPAAAAANSAQATIAANQPAPTKTLPTDRKSVVLGKLASVRVDSGGRRIIKKKEIPT